MPKLKFIVNEEDPQYHWQHRFRTGSQHAEVKGCIMCISVMYVTMTLAHIP